MATPGRVNEATHPGIQSATGLGGVGGLPALDDLTDVDASAPDDGDALIWDAGSSSWVPGAVSGSGGGDLDDLDDVDVPAPDDGDVLTWDDYLGLWVNKPPAELDLSTATVLWRPVMTTASNVVTTDGLSVWVPMVTVDGEAIMVYS